MSTWTPEDLRVAIDHGTGRVAVPPPDLDAVLRRRRTTTARRATVALLVAASFVAGAFALARNTPEVLDRGDRFGFADQGPLDLRDGARAYAVDGKVLHVGGNTYPWPSSIGLDTRSVATSAGLVFPDERGRPQLLGADGEVTSLDDTPADAVPEFEPSIRSDPATGRIAYALTKDGVVTLEVLSLDDRSEVASIELPCTGTCRDVQVDAFSDDRVFVSTGDGVVMWRVDQSADRIVDLGSTRTRIVDAHDKVLVYRGEEPRPLAGWRYVAGRSDDELTLDGAYVLSWSSTLRPTAPGGTPVVLDQGPTGQGGGLAFYSLDSDGSVLVATAVKYPLFDFYDCAIPSGSCTYLGREESGDPVFIGNDR